MLLFLVAVNAKMLEERHKSREELLSKKEPGHKDTENLSLSRLQKSLI